MTKPKRPIKMSDRRKELWARAIGSAFSEIIPTWPEGYTRSTAKAATFYTLWLGALGYKIWDM